VPAGIEQHLQLVPAVPDEDDRPACDAPEQEAVRCRDLRGVPDEDPRLVENQLAFEFEDFRRGEHLAIDPEGRRGTIFFDELGHQLTSTLLDGRARAEGGSHR